jgi:hypothetical protein
MSSKWKSPRKATPAGEISFCVHNTGVGWISKTAGEEKTNAFANSL